MFVFSSLDCFGLYCWCPNLCSDVRDNQLLWTFINKKEVLWTSALVDGEPAHNVSKVSFCDADISVFMSCIFEGYKKKKRLKEYITKSRTRFVLLCLTGCDWDLSWRITSYEESGLKKKVVLKMGHSFYLAICKTDETYQ